MATEPNVARRERYERGQALRTQCPRSSHATCQARDDSVDPLALIEESNVGRVPGLIPVRYERMSKTPFTFFRGSANLQAHDLLSTPVSGTIVQLGGDSHIMNFGGFATPERNLIFDINDFDETFPGPWEWDVKRLATSLVLAARSRGFSKAVARQAVRDAVASYREKMLEYAGLSTLEVWYVRIAFEELASFFKRNAAIVGSLGQIEKSARDQTSETVTPKLASVQDGRLRIVDDPPLIYHLQNHADEWAAHIRAFFHHYRHTLTHDRRRLFDRYVLQDFAVKVVGVGSVGTRCTVALFLSDATDPLFLQMKEARRSVIEPPSEQESRFEHQGERVVNGQRLMQAATDIFLGWAETADSTDYYVRQLRDMKVSIDVEQFAASTLCDYGVICGWALARGHAKAGDAPAIAGYLGRGDRFDRAIASYAAAYADQVERDFERFTQAIRSGRISVEVNDADLDFQP